MKKLVAFLLPVIVFCTQSSCKKDEVVKSSEKEILAFYIDNQIGSSLINTENSSVVVVLPDTIDKTMLSPTIEVSDKAVINPASGQVVDFSSGTVAFTVTAEDQSTREWMVSISDSSSISNKAEILSFSIKTFQRGETIFDETNISVPVLYGVRFSLLKPEIEISEGARISPEPEESDFTSGSVTYTVTAENGITKEWVASVHYAPNHIANIESFTVPGQVGESLIGDTTVNIEVDYGTDLSTLIPTIEISEGATISPESGTTVDFSQTGRVEYQVTAANGENIKTWGVYVNYPVIKADHPYYKFVGRFDYSDPERPRTWTPGSYMTARFTGNYCKIAIGDEDNGSGTQNFIEVIIDNTESLRYVLSEPHSTLDISSYLDEGEHTLLVCQTSETNQGYIDFIGLHLESADALLEPDPLPERKIEFIGNSISVGSGIDLRASGECGDWDDNHNAYYSYCARTARNLNAQWMITGRSGFGLIQSCCGNTATMPEVYGKMNLRTDGTQWDFSQYVPDVVAISLGQNDGVQDSATFCSAYVSFIGTIRSKYPNAYIICLNSPMGDDYLNNALVNYLDGVVEYLNGQGDDKVLTFELSHGHNSGCADHPDWDAHIQISDELTGFLELTLGW